jgi:Ca2+-binding EF-hand superfamily protein
VETILHMKEGIAGKIGNANKNAFKLRKLFAMYDTDKTGMVCESHGCS